jgi:hypothetical protein
VAGLGAGTTLTVVLGVPYDARSDFYFDGSLTPSLASHAPGCQAVDGLQTGSTGQFTLREPLVPVTPQVCSPWRADFAPEILAEPQLVVSGVPTYQGVTMAAAFAKGTLEGRSLLATRVLYSPSRDPQGVARPGGLPSLVVTRMLTWDTDPYQPCFDAWIASFAEGS